MFLPPEEVIITPEKGTLVWSDEFDDGTVPDASVWTHEIGAGGWGNNEVQTYTNSSVNSYVSGGTLKIKALKADSTWSSARLVSRDNKEWTYGYMEIRAKLPVGAGTWPAVWMMPADSYYGEWPASGEIDIMEHATSTSGLGNVFGTVHRQAGYGAAGFSGGLRSIPGAGSSFHTYAVEWSANSIKWFIDDEYLGNTYSRSGGTGSAWWPFDKPFYFILNVAIGGNLGGAISPTLTQDILEIDYVRVYR